MGKFYFAVLLAVLGTMAYMPMGRSQRSPYVPMPVNLPGLLPRFGAAAEDNSASSAASSSSSGGSQPASSSSGDDGFSMTSSGGRVGVRIGEDDIPARPLPSRVPNPERCPPQQVPCYDCMVYISRTGQITKFSAQSGGRRY